MSVGRKAVHVARVVCGAALGALTPWGLPGVVEWVADAVDLVGCVRRLWRDGADDRARDRGRW